MLQSMSKFPAIMLSNTEKYATHGQQREHHQFAPRVLKEHVTCVSRGAPAVLHDDVQRFTQRDSLVFGWQWQPSPAPCLVLPDDFTHTVNAQLVAGQATTF